MKLDIIHLHPEGAAIVRREMGSRKPVVVRSPKGTYGAITYVCVGSHGWVVGPSIMRPIRVAERKLRDIAAKVAFAYEGVQEHAYALVAKAGFGWVTAYAVEREYGGCEEGGWWYNAYEPLKTVFCHNAWADTVVCALEQEFADVAYGDIYSVLGGTALSVHYEEAPAEHATTERPYYE